MVCSRERTLRLRLLSFVSEIQNARWNSSDYCVVGYILSDNRTRSDDRVLADADSRQDRSIHSNVRAVSNHDRFDDQAGLDDGHVTGLTGVR